MMAGNEELVTKYIFQNLNSLTLKHLGLVKSIGIPTGNTVINLNKLNQLTLLSTQDAGKKADITINNVGVSIKQKGASFSYNRIQRAELPSLLKNVGFLNIQQHLNRIDKEVDDFHKGNLKRRNRDWRNLFSENDFKTLLRFLMLEGSPNQGISSFPAKYILTAPKSGIDQSNIDVYTFDEYFKIFKNKIYFSIRRQWIGQISESEHKRATGLAKKPGNKKWVYDDISGKPRKKDIMGNIWRPNVKLKNRKTVYFIMLEKKK